jgi:tetratricopeptide (TPR) repeat protein
MDLDAKRAFAKELGAMIRAALEGPGDVATRLGAIDAVRAKCRRAVELAEGAAGADASDFPTLVEAAFLVAEAHARTGKPEEAIAWFDRSDAAMKTLGVARESVGMDITTEAGLRGASLQAVGRAAEALPWMARFTNRAWRSLLRTNAEEHFMGLSADVVELAERVGTSHGLDPAPFVAGSAGVALRRYVDNRMEEAAQWIARSEEARGMAGLPLEGQSPRLADVAYFAGHELRTKQENAAALSIWSRAATLYEERPELDNDTRLKLGFIYSTLGLDLMGRVEADVKKWLAEKPPRLDAIAEHLAEPIRLHRRATELAAAVLAERPEETGSWAFYCHSMALMLDTSGQVEEALQCYDSILALHERIAPEQVVRAWLGRATSLHRLRRTSEAVASLRAAQKLIDGCAEDNQAFLRLELSLTLEALSQKSR